MTFSLPRGFALRSRAADAFSLGQRETHVLVEQTTVVDPQRLGRSAGRLDAGELRAVDDALSLILGL